MTENRVVPLYTRERALKLLSECEEFALIARRKDSRFWKFESNIESDHEFSGAIDHCKFRMFKERVELEADDET
jgi:hypothetical protein